MQTLEKLAMADTGSNPTILYFFTESANPQEYLGKIRSRRTGSIKTRLTLTLASRPTTSTTLSSRHIIGLENGSFFYTDGESLLDFHHQGSVSRAYYNESTEKLITGDETGQVLVAHGNKTTAFTLDFSYHEHTCKIISIIVHGNWIITSD